MHSAIEEVVRLSTTRITNMAPCHSVIELFGARLGYRVHCASVFAEGNKMTLETMIGSLTRDEKLAAIDLIWRDLAADSRPFESPVWHEKVIADRLDRPSAALPLAEAKLEIKEAIDARRAAG